MTARKSPSTRLSVDDWLQAGYTVLAEQGGRALKVENLCRQIGATRGSFYWHFQDMDSYRAALVESWNAFLERDRQSLADLDTLPPRDRLSAMMNTLVSPQHWMLERAMREWARTDPVAAANVREADRILVRSVAKAYQDYGFDADDARLRAELTFAAGIGLLHLAGSAVHAQKAAPQQRLLELMLANPT
ncbi:TetR/AcrR family transcriptional regulator [Mycobacterium shigaense]|uniref:TetR family transcriptional regulator n=1 Tax=Mycobacterium shigaense TaxID=722731 RepID=A0A1Z4EK52_9MYCO|nr:TetR/AcrR family transcriptional regulator [Mycobacterium shigaense]MEA1125068.1 TetR/AcrR family transcriptional regulator [Mycobacterium shigaense]PRI15656.1 TetR family transcriptional regulator [Mycobacterium shigaense]BAX93338.1 TetR family transcriptional regulator [Mycobacterium shigaense]